MPSAPAFYLIALEPEIGYTSGAWLTCLTVRL